jgi:hypothetical protein
VEEINDVLVIPNQAITGLDGQIIVFRLSTVPTSSVIPLFTWEQNPGDGGFKFPLTYQPTYNISINPISINLGTQSESHSEIKNGDLDPGDTIIFDPPEDLRNQS